MFDEVYRDVEGKLVNIQRLNNEIRNEIKSGLGWYKIDDVPVNFCSFETLLPNGKTIDNWVKNRVVTKEKELKVVYRSKPIRGIILELYSMR